MKRAPTSAVILAAALLAGRAHAQSEADRSLARELGRQGADAIDARKYDKALDLFRRADKILHAPTLTIGLARSLAGTGQLVAAMEAYERLARDGVGPKPVPAFVTAVAEGKREMAALEARLGRATLTTSPSEGVTVTVDGEPFPASSLGTPRAFVPGHHEVAVSASGYAGKTVAFDAVAGKRATVVVTLDPVAPVAQVHPPEGGTAPASRTGSPRRAVGFAVIGLGGASLLAGVVTGALAVSKKGTLDAACQPPTGGKVVCPSSESGTLDAFHAFGTASTGTLVAGALLAGIGLTLVLTAPADRPEGSVTARIGPFGGVWGTPTGFPIATGATLLGRF